MLDVRQTQFLQQRAHTAWSPLKTESKNIRSEYMKKSDINFILLEESIKPNQIQIKN